MAAGDFDFILLLLLRFLQLTPEKDPHLGAFEMLGFFAVQDVQDRWLQLAINAKR